MKLHYMSVKYDHYLEKVVVKKEWVGEKGIRTKTSYYKAGSVKAFDKRMQFEKLRLEKLKSGKILGIDRLDPFESNYIYIKV